MKTSSISQAKNQLSALLDTVRKGETVLITDRRRPVARLSPVGVAGRGEVAGWLEDLERGGLVRRGRKRLPSRWYGTHLPRTTGGASIVGAVLAERDEGRFLVRKTKHALRKD